MQQTIEMFKRGDLSPVEVVRDSLDRIDEINPVINAIYEVDREGALLAAAASERRWRAGAPIGPLDGIPITVKDALATKGMVTYRGSAADPGHVAEADHPTVSRVREAGSIVVGKSTMCDYGILASGVSSRFGVTRNPRNPKWNTGASSSGAAASVAAGIEPVTIGTDIVGSIRIPASYCGLVGLKPSQGRVPYYFPNHPALVAGPIARNVVDAAHLLNVLARPDRSDFSALPPAHVDFTKELEEFDPATLRILVINDLGLGAKTSPAVKSALVKAEGFFRAAGASVERTAAPPFDAQDMADIELHYMVRCVAELLKVPEEQQKLSPFIYSWTKPGREYSAVQYQESWNAIQRLRDRAYKLAGEADFIILPSTADTAFAAERFAPEGQSPFSLWSTTCLFNFTEQPAISLPLGADTEGKPIGVQIVGKRFDDLGILKAAYFLEKKSFAPSPHIE
ncbi:amidase [Mesorhizobium sp. L-8-10]|nr:amidase [Mesorhizobium sp. L-8-10]